MKKLILICLISSSVIAQNKPCKKISHEKDEFKGTSVYRSPVLEPVYFTKTKIKDSTIIFMSVVLPSSTSSTGDEVIILLNNGDKIEVNAKTKVKVNSSAQYEHSTIFTMTRDQIDILKKIPIKAIRLYVHDITLRKPEKYMKYLNCIDEIEY